MPIWLAVLLSVSSVGSFVLGLGKGKLTKLDLLGFILMILCIFVVGYSTGATAEIKRREPSSVSTEAKVAYTHNSNPAGN